MRYIDITRTIEAGMDKYPSDPEVEITEFKSIRRGNSCNLRKLTLSSHAGTHVDVPRHIFDEGQALDDISIGDFICRVAVAPIGRSGDERFLKRMSDDGVRGLLLKSDGKRSGLTAEEAGRLLKYGIRIVGTEGMSIDESADKRHPAHRMLLGRGVIVVEGLTLAKARPGRYTLICLPLKIKDGDGAPVRAVLAYDKSCHI
ncbi:MAG: cyclase family protein [Candidatus Omnitrophota bacterium]